MIKNIESNLYIKILFFSYKIDQGCGKFHTTSDFHTSLPFFSTLVYPLCCPLTMALQCCTDPHPLKITFFAACSQSLMYLAFDRNPQLVLDLTTTLSCQNKSRAIFLEQRDRKKSERIRISSFILRLPCLSSICLVQSSQSKEIGKKVK